MSKFYGIGINDYKGNISFKGKHIKSYRTWKNILLRCYSEKSYEKNPTYKNCTICEEWKSFSNFKEWYDKNYPAKFSETTGIQFELDKDLLCEKNKEYGPKTCIFLPVKINRFISIKYKNNTSGYTGVVWRKDIKKWHVQTNDFDTNKRRHFGNFEKIEDANNKYIEVRALEVLKAKKYMKILGYDDAVTNKLK